MPYPQIECDTDGPIGCLTLNNPEKINALSTIMIAERTEATHTLGDDQVDTGDEKAPAYGASTIALNGLAEDARIGIHAFLEKTTPEW
jgi:hypothetical protein